jgi:hypothetical protein
VWGTRICVTDVQDSFRKFLSEFCETTLDEDELLMDVDAADGVDRKLPYYLQRLQEVSLFYLHFSANQSNCVYKFF